MLGRFFLTRSDADRRRGRSVTGADRSSTTEDDEPPSASSSPSAITVRSAAGRPAQPETASIDAHNTRADTARVVVVLALAHIEDPHHPHVLVLEVVTVKDEPPREGPELHEYLRVEIAQQHGVLLCRHVRRRGLAIDLLDLEGLQVKVNRVHPAARVVLENPPFRRADLWSGVIAIGIEEPVVDHPGTVFPLELDPPGPDDLARVDRRVGPQGFAGPDGGVVLRRPLVDDELDERRDIRAPFLWPVDVFLGPATVVEDKIVLIYFMFTICEGICPATTANVARMQDLLGDLFGRDTSLSPSR